jgi:hypothetical protein
MSERRQRKAMPIILALHPQMTVFTGRNIPQLAILATTQTNHGVAQPVPYNNDHKSEIWLSMRMSTGKSSISISKPDRWGSLHSGRDSDGKWFRE